MNRKMGTKLMFAMLAVCGGGALVSCGMQYDNPILPSSQTGPTAEELSISAENEKQQKIDLENDIETGILQKLNTNFQDYDWVKSVDIKHFTLQNTANQQSQSLDATTLCAHGTITFRNDDEHYGLSLAMNLSADDMLGLTPIYYVDADPSKNLVANYRINDLQAVKNYINGSTFQLDSAKLNDIVWDLNSLSPAQMVKQMENKIYDCICRFQQDVLGYDNFQGRDVDLKGFFINEEQSLVLSGVAGFKNTYKQILEMKFKVSDANIKHIQSLKNEYSTDLFMKDNYDASTISTIHNVVNDQSTKPTAYRYRIPIFIDFPSDLTFDA